MFHLTLADALVSFITMPMEAAWRFTMQVMLHNFYSAVSQFLKINFIQIIVTVGGGQHLLQVAHGDQGLRLLPLICNACHDFH